MANYRHLKEGEKAVITKQLERQPRNLAGVALECPAGYPRVIVTHPVIFHEDIYPEVFPTLYWLSCPRLVKEVSRLEGGGAIEEIQEQIFSNPELTDMLVEVHKRYANQRTALVKQSTLERLEEEYPAQHEVLLHSGVGGIMDKGIKCLHTHLADYLVNGDNPVGKLVVERLGEKMTKICAECGDE